jgi:hypothetical protein
MTRLRRSLASESAGEMPARAAAPERDRKRVAPQFGLEPA